MSDQVEPISYDFKNMKGTEFSLTVARIQDDPQEIVNFFDQYTALIGDPVAASNNMLYLLDGHGGEDPEHPGVTKNPVREKWLAALGERFRRS